MSRSLYQLPDRGSIDASFAGERSTSCSDGAEALIRDPDRAEYTSAAQRFDQVTAAM
jgi:hypothetical protein